MRPLLILLLSIFLLSPVLAQQAEPVWKMHIELRDIPLKGKDYSKRYWVLECHSPTMSVDFTTRVFWTVHEIFLGDVMLGRASGATGTVVHWEGEAIGTGHRGKKRSEELTSVTLTVDGKAYDMMEEGRKGFAVQGNNVTLLKHSTIGPLRHEAQFDFDPRGEYYTATHRFEVIEKITPEKFKGYRYCFMQMMPKHVSLWKRYGGDEGIREGEMSQPDPAKDKRKQTFVFNHLSMRALACYSLEHEVGIAYIYPRVYPGHNHYLDRFWKDNKFRGILFEKDAYDVGEQFEYEMRVHPFKAAKDSWQTVAESLIESP